MNGLDVLLLAVIGVSGVMSFRVGLIREAFALGALLIGLLAGVVLGRAYAASIPDFVGNPAATQVLFFLASFLVVYILVTLIGTAIARLVRNMHLGWADHLLGLTFGLLRGSIVVLLLLAGLVFVLPDLVPKHPEVLTDSAVFRIAGGPLRVFSQVLPEKAAQELRERHQLYHDLRARRGAEEREHEDDSPAPMGL